MHYKLPKRNAALGFMAQKKLLLEFAILQFPLKINAFNLYLLYTVVASIVVKIEGYRPLPLVI